jgi:outer membrane protein OmpA-like peptidoglycan-associated protein
MSKLSIVIIMVSILTLSGCNSLTPTHFGVLPIAVEESPEQVNVILLPQDNGKVGKVIVSDSGNEAILDEAWQTVETKNLDKKEILSKEIVEAKYGQLLQGMPKKLNNYLIYFKSGSTEMTSDATILTQIIEDIKSNSALEVDIVGYADRTGGDEYNKMLSLKRTYEVAKFLVAAGVKNEIIVLDFYGEENPIVQTEDGVANELNRRVEVTVK